MKEMKEGNAEVKWSERVPYAYWKGTPFMGGNRLDLVKCNVSKERDWNARIYSQVHIHSAWKFCLQQQSVLDCLSLLDIRW